MSEVTTQAKNDDNKNQGGRSPFFWLVWAAIVAILSLIAWGLFNNTKMKPLVGDQAPDFELFLFDGYDLHSAEQISLSDLEGKVVVLNFWASWCLECTYEAADLEAAWREYGPDDVVFIGVSYIDVESQSLDFLERFDITYPNGLDIRSEIADEYQVVQVPETFIIDKSGTVVDFHFGPVDVDRMIAAIELARQ